MPSKLRKIIVLPAFALLLTVVGCSGDSSTNQTGGTVSGHVFLEDTDATIPKVVVTVDQLSYRTVTNGFFKISGLPTGIQIISAHKDGYRPHTDTIEVLHDTEYNIRLFRLDTPL